MALLFCDGFDHYDTPQLLEKWDGAQANGSPITVNTPGRNSGATYNGYVSLPRSSTLTKVCPDSSTLTLGAAFNPTSLVTQNICSFYDQNTTQISVGLTENGALQVQNGSGTVLGTTADGLITPNVFTYVEIQVVFATTAIGAVTLCINATSVLTLTNIVTAESVNAYANLFTLYGTSDYDTGAAFGYDDLYVCDATGTQNTSFLGNTKVALALPNGTGVSSNWSQTGGSGSGHYTAVSEVPPDNYTSYVSSSIPGQVDAYTLSSVGTLDVLYAVQLVMSATKPPTGSRLISLGFSNGSAAFYDAGHALYPNFMMARSTLDTNPVTGAAWTTGDLSDAQIALKVLT